MVWVVATASGVGGRHSVTHVLVVWVVVTM